MRYRLLSFLGTVSVLTLVLWVGYAEKKKQDQSSWQYKVITTTGITHEQLREQKELNSLGARGWELVAVVNMSTPDCGGTARLYLKRGR